MLCPACGEPNPESANFCQKCGKGLTPLAQMMDESQGTGVPRSQYGGFWRRFAAFWIDEVLLVICVLIMTFFVKSVLLHQGIAKGPRQAVGIFLSVVTGWLYWSIMESSPNQATVGKTVLGIVVTDLEGRRISFSRATGRYFSKIVSSLILGIGFLMAGWTAKKQALHDMMAGTLVVLKK